MPPTRLFSCALFALAQAATGHCPEAIGPLTDRFHNSANPDLARLAGLALVPCVVAEGQPAAVVPLVGQLEARYPNDADVLYLAARVHMMAFNDATRRMFEKTPASYRVNQQELQKLQHPPEGEFTDFLKRLGERTPGK